MGGGGGGGVGGGGSGGGEGDISNVVVYIDCGVSCTSSPMVLDKPGAFSVSATKKS